MRGSQFAGILLYFVKKSLLLLSQLLIHIQKGEGGEGGGQSKWISAPSRCDVVIRNITVHIIFARS